MNRIFRSTFTRSIDQALQTMISYPAASQRLRPIASFLAKNEHRKSQVDKLFDNLKPGNKFFKIAERVAGLNPRARRGLIYNFAVKGLTTKPSVPLGDGEEINAPQVLSFFPTKRCNLKCDYCYVPFDKTLDMPEAMMHRLLREAEQFKTVFFCVAGGEPSLYDNLFEIFADYPTLYFLVFTNGAGIDDKAIEVIDQAGNIMPIFGLDGLEETTSNVRSARTWNHFQETSAKMRDRRMAFGFSCHVDRRNFEEAYSEEYVKMLHDSGALCGWYSHHIAMKKKDFKELVLTPKQRIDALLRIEQLREKYPLVLIDSATDPRYQGGCPAGGYTFLHVDNLGNISPCPLIPYPVGNMEEMTLGEAIASKYFRGVRRLGRMNSPRDHVAGCIALDKHDKLIDLALNDEQAREAGSAREARRWEPMREDFVRYQAELDAYIDTEVTFRRQQLEAEPNADEPHEREPSRCDDNSVHTQA